jgi:hypothetical protein
MIPYTTYIIGLTGEPIAVSSAPNTAVKNYGFQLCSLPIHWPYKQIIILITACSLWKKIHV